jgi:hypothetical protein
MLQVVTLMRPSYLKSRPSQAAGSMHAQVRQEILMRKWPIHGGRDMRHCLDPQARYVTINTQLTLSRIAFELLLWLVLVVCLLRVAQQPRKAAAGR